MTETPTKAADIIRSLPQRFKKNEVDPGTQSVFHFDISGKNGGQFTVYVDENECRVVDGLEGEAECMIKAQDDVYEEVELGKRNAQMAVFMGKIKISNLPKMLQFINLFDRLYKRN
ncbi:MAG: SCP2 sterol-binding domain-containing protein [Chitinophagales bacterium]|nr:SCP2 sterol-binding domain-containing protein [Bacteroidota bacterium]MCB9043830.1 SCP2 sterol-binding domain-containing protein [Chitinophagales bacterium]